MSIPPSTPYPDVRFDQAAASGGAAACVQAAAAVEELAALDRRAALAAVADWNGPHRSTFDERFRTLHEALAQLTDDLRAAAARIEAAARDAAAAQVQRELQRAAWLDGRAWSDRRSGPR